MKRNIKKWLKSLRKKEKKTENHEEIAKKKAKTASLHVPLKSSFKTLR
jgi:hypothetical protein